MQNFSFRPTQTSTARVTAIQEAERWLRQTELLDLCVAFGFDASLAENDLGTFASLLATFSDKWDFRRGVERDAVSAAEHVYDLQTLITQVRSIGLVEPVAPPENDYEHLIVLGGTLLSCHERVAFASTLVASGRVHARHIWLLGTDRSPSDAERAATEGLSSNVATSPSEFEALLRCAESFFPLESWVESDGPKNGDASRNAISPAGFRVHVLCSASRSDHRRANTEDTYEHFMSLSHAGPRDKALICTSQIYVPFQYFGAVRMLGISAGVSIDMSGYDSTGGFAGSTDQVLVKRYLQETRSGILAVRNLLVQIGVIDHAD